MSDPPLSDIDFKNKMAQAKGLDYPLYLEKNLFFAFDSFPMNLPCDSFVIK